MTDAPDATDTARPAFDAAFDAAFRLAAPERAGALGLDCRPERADDRAFLADLFVACSPLAGLLPDVMMQAQARLQYDAYAAAFPRAMCRIAVLDGLPIGRIAVDWDGPATHCIDVAVLPGHRATGAGPRLLRAWLAVADAAARPATLEVGADNPAARLYRRLGFAAVPGGDGVRIDMARPPGASAT